ncbi:AAA family ATPase [Patescibacteria group bacterium]|nr:AAA family ATPase [Patescibacteria group bacterium]
MARTSQGAMIIGITGTLGAGKGAVVEYLSTKGFAHHSARELITEEILRRGEPVNRDTMTHTANDMRRIHGPTYPQEQLFMRAAAQGKDAVVESVRSVAGAKFMKEHGAYLLAVDADPRLRYERIGKRGSETDQVDFDTFLAHEAREMESDDPHHQNIRGVMALSDYTIENDGTLEELHRKVDDMLAAFGRK